MSALLKHSSKMALKIAIRSASRRPNYVKDFEEGLVYLFQFPRMNGFPNLSPFCLKLESWLRFGNIKYKNVENLPMMHRSSEGTLPYVELNGQEYNDSAFIIRDLPAALRITSPDSHLSTEEKAVSLAFERLVENSLFLGSGKFRYEHMDEILAMWPSKFGVVQPVFNLFVKKFMVYKVNEKLMVAGMGRHTREEIIKIVHDDLQALSSQLGKRPYLMGDKPTKLDASAFAALALILEVPFNTPAKEHIIQNLPNLKAYTEHIKETFWPDWNSFKA